MRKLISSVLFNSCLMALTLSACQPTSQSTPTPSASPSDSALPVATTAKNWQENEMEAIATCLKQQANSHPADYKEGQITRYAQHARERLTAYQANRSSDGETKFQANLNLLASEILYLDQSVGTGCALYDLG